MWGGRTEPRVPIPRTLDALSRGLSTSIVRHLHRCRSAIFFLRRGNMATPAAVNPSGKSLPAVSVQKRQHISLESRGRKEGSSVLFRPLLSRAEAATGRRSLARASIPLPPLNRGQHGCSPRLVRPSVQTTCCLGSYPGPCSSAVCAVRAPVILCEARLTRCFSHSLIQEVI